MRTRVKICGITRSEDAQAAARAGADAIGLVFYPPSPRFLSLEWARQLAGEVPPFVTTVALFVNPAAAEVYTVLERVRPAMLQFHGEEDPVFCAQFGVPYVKACRVKPGIDLLEYLRPFSSAAGWLLDSHVEEYGGVGESFDWSLVPEERARAKMRPLVLSGGLAPGNVGQAIRQLRPWAVDVSSGVESAKGVKDAAKISAFMTEVRNADV
jgi:phosphoribosylanthranilate isomerase